MRRLFSSLVMIVIFMFFAWAVSAWYFGSQNEKNFHRLLNELSQLNKQEIIDIEILDYRKTWLGAQAVLSVSSSISEVNERLSNTLLNADITNGPIFISEDNKSINFGSSYWNIKSNQKNLAETVQYVPVSKVKIGFDDNATYQIKLLDSKTHKPKIKISGSYHLKSKKHQGLIHADDLKGDSSKFVVQISKANLRYENDDSVSATGLPAKLSFNFDDVRIKSKSSNAALNFDMSGNEDIHLNNNNINGIVKIILNNNSKIQESNTIPWQQSKIEISMQDISVNGLFTFNTLKAEVDNLIQQEKWVLEEQGELPEGQNQIWQIQQEAIKAQKQLFNILSKDVYGSKQANIHFKMITNHQKGDSIMKGQLIPTKTPNESYRFIDMLEANANVSLNTELFNYLNKNLGISKSNFKLQFKQNKLLMQ